MLFVHRLKMRAIVTLCALLSIPASAEAQTRLSIPSDLLGEFVDDYGIPYVVTPESWLQGTEARYEIEEWNVRGRFLIARNGGDNPTEPGLWTRIDWVVLASEAGYDWAFCYAVFDAASKAAARAGEASVRETPRTGCNGYPFSRMRRLN